MTKPNPKLSLIVFLIALNILVLCPQSVWAWVSISIEKAILPADGKSKAKVDVYAWDEEGKPSSIAITFSLSPQVGSVKPNPITTGADGRGSTTYQAGTIPGYVFITAASSKGSDSASIALVGVEIEGPKFVTVDQEAAFEAKITPSSVSGTFAWEIIQGKNRVQIIGSSSEKTLRVKGIKPSQNIDDVTLSLTFIPTGADPKDWKPVKYKFTVGGVEVLNVDASDPLNAKVNYQVEPPDVVLTSATFTAPGKTETKTGLSGYFYFTYNQNNLHWHYGNDATPETISLSTTIYDTPYIVNCTANRIRSVTPQAREMITAFFLVENVGLRPYIHGLSEVYDKVFYSITSYGKTIWVGNSTASLLLRPDYNEIEDHGWTETHKYKYLGGVTPIQGMTTAAGLGNPDTRYKDSSSNMWLEINGLKGMATVDNLIYQHETGIAPAVSITNRNIDRSIP